MVDETKKLDIMSVLDNIDSGNMNYFKDLDVSLQNSFSPYVVMQWMSSLDDSLSITYRSKDVESVFGKWSSKGKETLNELIKTYNDEMNSNVIGSVSKSEYGKYDWRISFNVNGTTDEMNEFIKFMKESFSLEVYSTEQLLTSDMYKQYLIILNDFVNNKLWKMQDNNALIYELMCSVSTLFGKMKFKRSWLQFIKSRKNFNEDIYNIVTNHLSDITKMQLSLIEYKLVLNKFDEISFIDQAEDMGFQEVQIKKLLKQFIKEKEIYG